MKTIAHWFIFLVAALQGLSVIPAAADPIVIIVEEMDGDSPEVSRGLNEDKGAARVLGSETAYIVPFRNRNNASISSAGDLARNGVEPIEDVRDGIEKIIMGYYPGVPFVIVSEGWASVATGLALAGGSVDGAGTVAPAATWKGASGPYQSIQHLITVDSPLGGEMEGVTLAQARPENLRRWTNLYDPALGGPVREAANMVVRDEEDLLHPLSSPGYAPDILDVVIDLYRETAGDRQLDALLGEAFDIGLYGERRKNAPLARQDDKPRETNPPQTWADLEENEAQDSSGEADDVPSFDGLNLTGAGVESARAPVTSDGENVEPEENSDDAPESEAAEVMDRAWERALELAAQTPPPTLQEPPAVKSGRIIFFGHELASGDLDDSSLPAVLDADHVVIVVEYDDGSTEILDRAGAIPVLRARGFLEPGSLALTQKGRRGYDTSGEETVDVAQRKPVAVAPSFAPSFPNQTSPESNDNPQPVKGNWITKMTFTYLDTRSGALLASTHYYTWACGGRDCTDPLADFEWFWSDRDPDLGTEFALSSIECVGPKGRLGEETVVNTVGKLMDIKRELVAGPFATNLLAEKAFEELYDSGRLSCP
jgi:hypothetical protein